MAVSHVRILHILLIGPLLMYVGLMKPAQTWVYYALGTLGLGIFIRFLWEFASSKLSQRSVWYVLHFTLFAGLLLVAAWYGPTAPQIVFSLLLAVGVAALGYHSIRALN